MTEMPHVISEYIVELEGQELKVYRLSNGEKAINNKYLDELLKVIKDKHHFCHHIFESLNFTNEARCAKCYWRPKLEKDPNLRWST